MSSAEGTDHPTALDTLIRQAIDALSGTELSIADAIQHVPPAPGLYAVYAEAEIWVDLGLAVRTGCPLYVGKAEKSLQSRDIRTHFASGRTGSSTVRRSFAALLRDVLELRGVPRNQQRPERPANFGLEADADARLTDWMHERLRLAYWAQPDTHIKLDDIETAVIRTWQPPLNLDKVDQRSPALTAARRRMVDDARTWARARGFDLS